MGKFDLGVASGGECFTRHGHKGSFHKAQTTGDVSSPTGNPMPSPSGNHMGLPSLASAE